MGPIQRAESRNAVISRMIALMDEARAKEADLIVYPELALTDCLIGCGGRTTLSVTISTWSA
jgi:predicted amidohydrolase